MSYPNYIKGIKRMPSNSIVTENKFNTADELFDTLVNLFSKDGGNYNAIFRGVSDARHYLIPSALRCDTFLWCGDMWCKSSGLNNLGQIEAEIMTLAEFSRIVDKAGMHLSVSISGLILEYFLKLRREYHETNTYHSWPPEELLPLLGLAQHYGIPTRLLDWSENPLKAAYFSVCKVKTEVEKVAIWALTGLGLQQFPTLWKAAGRSLLTLVKAPYADNPNLHAQQGIHTIYRTELFDLQTEPDRRPLDILLSGISGNNVLRILKFTLPASEASSLLRLLAKWNISAATLFPGYKGCADAFHEQRHWTSSE